MDSGGDQGSRQCSTTSAWLNALDNGAWHRGPDGAVTQLISTCTTFGLTRVALARELIDATSTARPPAERNTRARPRQRDYFNQLGA